MPWKGLKYTDLFLRRKPCEVLRDDSFSLKRKRRKYMVFNGVKVPLTYSDAASREVQVINKTIPGREKPGSGGRTCNMGEVENSVVVQKTVQCPPHSGIFIHGQVQNGTRHPEVCICGITDRVLVPRTVVTVKTNMVNVWVVNDGPKPVTLKGGMVVARVEPVEQTFHQDSASREVPPKNFVPTSREDNDGDSLSSVTEEFIDDFDDFYRTRFRLH
ncbi:uncharacterized protein LOC122266081 [Penaeus japonicus]|uniref:uncharacterized protein LOC122266081 n=1 Tax=Penaeus japonicus TaxID=27405 RepID=UPI001C716D7C|nr:uncharacterized protein LOC122266081 [Penaeus japonicus]